jgi:hypothetical protein
LSGWRWRTAKHEHAHRAQKMTVLHNREIPLDAMDAMDTMDTISRPDMDDLAAFHMV